MLSQRRNCGRPCRMRTVWRNCDFYVRWYETYLLFSFEDAFQAWFDAISDERVAQRMSVWLCGMARTARKDSFQR